MTRTRAFVGAALIGLALLTVALYFGGLSASGTAEIVGYYHTNDPRRIVVLVALGRLDDVAERVVTEDDRSVHVTVRKQTSLSGSALADLQTFPVTISLPVGHQFGDRTVLDDKAKAVRDLGMYQLPASP